MSDDTMIRDAENQNEVYDLPIYTRIRSFLPFRARFAYVDEMGKYYVGPLFKQRRVRVKPEDGYVNDDSGLMIGIVTVPRRQITDFVECMERHKKNSILLWWGVSDDCLLVLRTLHGATV